ncbi:MAG: copper chaperone PCu(A)C [Chloroflexales bacterium]
MRKRIHMLGAVLCLLVLAACGASPAKPAASDSASSTKLISIADPWARAAAMTGASASGATATSGAAMADSGGTSAAYLTITNSGSTADALLKAESDVANSVELHTMTMVDNVMKMTPVEKIDIPASGKAELKPGGFHVMLIGLRHDLKEGDVVKLTLTFQTAGKVEVEAPVRKP